MGFTAGQPVQDGFSDQCSSFWHGGHFAWQQVLANVAYYASNLWASVLYVVFVAAAVPVHLKYLSKVCFLALVCTAYTPCLLNLSEMALQIRQLVSPTIAPASELLWIFSI